MIYAIGDIHGCYDELKELLEKLPLEKEDEVVFLGDYVDRGPNSKGVIDYVIQFSKQHKCTFLMGNHENMFINYINHPNFSNASLYLYPVNGGQITMQSYGCHVDELPTDHIDFLNNLELFYETDDFFFVHAAVPNKPLSNIRKHPKLYKDYLLWEREKFLKSNYKWEKTIIHGHTPLEHALPDFRNNRINLDTSCVFGGYLTCIELPTMELYRVKCKGDYFSNLKKDYDWAIDMERQGKSWR